MALLAVEVVNRSVSRQRLPRQRHQHHQPQAYENHAPFHKETPHCDSGLRLAAALHPTHQTSIPRQIRCAHFVQPSRHIANYRRPVYAKTPDHEFSLFFKHLSNKMRTNSVLA
jgi:hypothetical protein